MGNSKVYEIVTDRIINALSQGIIPWEKPWNVSLHMNLASKKHYRGMNQILLGLVSGSSHYWVTYKQAKKLGGQVKKGAKSQPVIFWNFITKEDKKTGEEKTFPILRYYNVFDAVNDCTGLEKHIPETKVFNTETTNEIAEKIINEWEGKPSISFTGTRAYYRPANDSVTLPPKETFKSLEGFYSTYFHELTHSTGHETRLNRKGIIEVNNHDKETYSKEELIAELGAAFLCAEVGISERTIENQASYIQGWLQALKNDTRMVVTASSQAQKAVDLIMNRSFEANKK